MMPLLVCIGQPLLLLSREHPEPKKSTAASPLFMRAMSSIYRSLSWLNRQLFLGKRHALGPWALRNALQQGAVTAGKA